MIDTGGDDTRWPATADYVSGVEIIVILEQMGSVSRHAQTRHVASGS